MAKARAKTHTFKPAKSRAAASPEMKVGTGGETHQQSGNGLADLTTQQGIPVADDQNTLRQGPRGPALLEDFHFREKVFHFDHERVPERVVHARGYAAHGFFELTTPLSDLTRADIFQRKGERTPAFVRFSTVAGSKGSADLARDVRGFAVKLYTKEGNWDLVGNNIPVFFIQDAIKFPDLIHAAKPEPDRDFPQAQTAHDNFWDFISLTPESMHMIMWAMSDRAIPRSFRFMEGFGVHTFRLLDTKGRSTFVKFHWKPVLGLQSAVWNEAVKINGADPDFHRRDLWQAIESGNFPEWQLGVQLFDDTFADKFDFDVLDPTKLIPEELVPVRIVGRLVLDRLVDNFFAETEQVAFCTQNVPPGIDFSNDPLLQGRNFSYLDTQIKRLGGPNFTHIPINAPKCPYAHFQQDGHMAMRNPVGRANYEPNSWGAAGGPRENPIRGTQSFAENADGPKQRVRSETFADHYSQARQFFISQTPTEQAHIANALVFELSKVEREDIPRLDEAALTFVTSKWRWYPPTLHCRPVEALTKIQIVWSQFDAAPPVDDERMLLGREVLDAMHFDEKLLPFLRALETSDRQAFIINSQSLSASQRAPALQAFDDASNEATSKSVKAQIERYSQYIAGHSPTPDLQAAAALLKTPIGQIMFNPDMQTPNNKQDLGKAVLAHTQIMQVFASLFGAEAQGLQVATQRRAEFRIDLDKRLCAKLIAVGIQDAGCRAYSAPSPQ